MLRDFLAKPQPAGDGRASMGPALSCISPAAHCGWHLVVGATAGDWPTLADLGSADFGLDLGCQHIPSAFTLACSRGDDPCLGLPSPEGRHCHTICHLTFITPQLSSSHFDQVLPEELNGPVSKLDMAVIQAAWIRAAPHTQIREVMLLTPQ